MFKNKFMVNYNLKNDSIQIGGQNSVNDESIMFNASNSYSIVIKKNKAATTVTNPKAYKEIKVNSMSIETIKFLKARWWMPSFII